MKTVQVRDLVIGDSVPKICVPIVSSGEIEIIKDIEKLNKTDHDLMELRIDYFKDYADYNKVTNLLKKIREIYFKPIIFTYRTKKEGGMQDIDEEEYFKLNSYIIESKLIDLIDIELSKSDKKIKSIIKIAAKNNTKVILSTHNFDKTPNENEIINCILKMQEFKADITKIAVMSKSEEDVLTLLSASLKMKKTIADRPFITMSMGSLGTITRVSGELFGSSITFASLNKVSAPGQLSVENTKKLMDFFHTK